VQLHQLTPNSILHIACFITPCEAFLGINPHWGLWKYLFCLRHNVSKEKFTTLAAPLYLCNLNRSILHLRWLNQSKIGGISGSTLNTRNILKPVNMDWPL
jgi:hypothetical protein